MASRSRRALTTRSGAIEWRGMFKNPGADGRKGARRASLNPSATYNLKGSSMKNYVQRGDVITATAPANVTSGDGVLVGLLFGVARPGLCCLAPRWNFRPRAS